MAELGTLSVALGGVKAAMEIARGIMGDLQLEKAELKRRLADITVALAEARTDLVGVQEIIAAKDAEIARLEEAFAAKDALGRSGDAYYLLDPQGQPAGDPICMHCWETEHRQHSLVRDPTNRIRFCPACRTKYDARSTLTNPAPPAP